MQDTQLYSRILGIAVPWEVSDVQVSVAEKQVTVVVSLQEGSVLRCPECSNTVPGYDHLRRRWRDLDTHRFGTYIEADVPRVECPEHGVRQIDVPWAEGRSRLTLLFESLVIDWLRCAPMIEVARLTGLSWNAIDRIQRRAVARGLERREAGVSAHLSVDETSFQKRHEYVTVVSDQQTGAVLHVADHRKATSLEEYFTGLNEEQREGIKTVSMDMWDPYIETVNRAIAGAETKICFDKFHVAQHLSKAVDTVRRQEQKGLLARGDGRLKKSRYVWLRNPETMSDRMWERLEALRRMSLKTGRAWSLKENAMAIFRYRSRRWAEAAWKVWLRWAVRSRLEPIRKVAGTIKTYLWGIVNAMAHQRTNALAESINARIQRIKRQACGFRNRERFRTAIYFHLGQLDLYPTIPSQLLPT